MSTLIDNSNYKIETLKNGVKKLIFCGEFPQQFKLKFIDDKYFAEYEIEMSDYVRGTSNVALEIEIGSDFEINPALSPQLSEVKKNLALANYTTNLFKFLDKIFTTINIGVITDVSLISEKQSDFSDIENAFYTYLQSKVEKTTFVDEDRKILLELTEFAKQMGMSQEQEFILIRDFHNYIKNYKNDLKKRLSNIFEEQLSMTSKKENTLRQSLTEELAKI